MNRALLPTASLSLLLAVGCGPVPVPGQLVSSSKQRVTQAAPEADAAATVTANTTFALDLYRSLAGAGNVVFSPYSITTALAMTYAGARGDTAKAFEDTLHVALPADRFHRAMNTLDAALQSRGRGAQGKDGKPFRLAVTNQLFSQKGFALVPDFLDVLATEYGSGVSLLDFRKDPEAARAAVNGWISASTQNLIPELLAKGSVTQLTRLVLVNTIYFNAAWATKFKADETREGAFTLLDGTTATVKMMNGEVSGAHGTVGGTAVVELPYDGGEVSLLLLAPPAGTLGDFERALTAAKLQQYVAALSAGSFAMSMPKFDFKLHVDLGEQLSALGLGPAFGDAADFSGMTTSEPLHISSVVHEAVIKTDEAGTEAAAATAVVMDGRSAVVDTVTVDRPFLFVVRDVQTGSVVFLGRVVDPR